MFVFLVCKKCGHKVYDDASIRAIKKKFAGKGLSTHDIPYFCGACQDSASDDEYIRMQVQMEGKSEYVVCHQCAKIVTDGRIIKGLKKKFPNVKDISTVPYRCKCCESVYGNLY